MGESVLKTFRCTCGNTVHFENDTCLVCGRALGFIPGAHAMGAFDSIPGRVSRAAASTETYRACANYTEHQTCNWMVPESDADEFCISCRLNSVIPDLSDSRRVQLWYEVEKAKRRLLYTLMTLGLPIEGKDLREDGLAFRILADARLDSDSAIAPTDDPVTTGHYEGSITINLLEADASKREQMREAMQERYRTLLGHFRHESGHYYWARLVLDPTIASTGSARVDGARAVFGDERADYAATLSHYYKNGPPPDWRDRHISKYAASHPFEDFAETWAHHLHIVDTLETAADSDVQISGRVVRAPTLASPQYELLKEPDMKVHFDDMLNDWSELTLVMNRLNRSMGLADAYPFALSQKVIEKLRYVHDLIEQSTPR
ncbi:MAG: putative zinc-binding peptidase [Gammaproteobacteria bacterium]|nr:putative zinc-binding peptidase [Gammaproteobacteria bacterium]